MTTLVPSPVNGYYSPDDPGEPGRDGDIRLSINDLEGRILAEFARDREVLEIGTGLGVSTRWLASTARCVETLDIDPWVKEAVAPGLSANVIFYDDPAKIAPGADLVFIDGLHTFDACMADIAYARRMVKPGGVLIFHDFYIEGVMNAVGAVFGNGFVHIQTVAGIAVVFLS